MSDTWQVVRVDNRIEGGICMDLVTVLTAGVALLIAVSGYLLFNDPPGMVARDRERKTFRR